MTEEGPPTLTAVRVRWPWWLFGLAAAWVVLSRVPLVVNADRHLDSDLAVDGLTLLDATRGHWRWHYPGTPHMGIVPVLFSWPQAVVFGATPATLVSGGTVAFVGLLLACFLLAWLADGPNTAAWSLVPLTFASNGAVWLSGRITGGHLVAAAWHAGAFAWLVALLGLSKTSSVGSGWLGSSLRDPGAQAHAPGVSKTRPQPPGGRPRGIWTEHALLRGRKRSAALALGVWCGIGLYLDSMFVVTLVGLVAAGVVGWLGINPAGTAGPTKLALAALVVAGFLVGLLPKVIGSRVDPYDAYREQFDLVTRRDVLRDHAGLLVRECLPRLIAGHKLPGLETDPDPSTIGGPSRRDSPEWTAPVATGLSLGLWGASTVGLAAVAVRGKNGLLRTVAVGLIVSGLATCAGFVTSRNIFNSDNYRYLVTWLVPWSLGFGVLMDRLARRGSGGRAFAALLAAGLAVVMTADLGRWYARFGWLDARGRLVHQTLDDPVLDWLRAHPEVTSVEGGYWDVYRLSFLTGGRVRGTPFPVYPVRFPKDSATAGAGRTAVVVRGTPEGRYFGELAVRAGGTAAFRGRGLTVILMP
jgi:hypothetical protein